MMASAQRSVRDLAIGHLHSYPARGVLDRSNFPMLGDGQPTRDGPCDLVGDDSHGLIRARQKMSDQGKVDFMPWKFVAER
jgi:hypothetical protein